ncbi:hypothetical protein ES702_05653 [subsurface metagenome]
MEKRNYIPGTETTRRRPTPTEFEHLRRWLAVDEKYIDITNITNLKNINQQLEMTSKLFVSNVISRVIAQLLGAYGDGFVTLEGTAAGELKVKLTAADIASLIAIELAAGTNLIGKVEIAGTSRTVLYAKIDFSTDGNHEIVAAVSGDRICIQTIMFTVAGETNITLKTSTTAMTGALDFGGTDEPRGMTHNLGDFPLKTVAGQSFQISSSIAVQVSGFITYFLE